ncbi:unnamed protein product [Polarella glacialis]|uniref:Methyltransferase domain-containing protein n=1 Tax=Polarella glacialis TaxID=89957 RepID=A0A813FWK4_POLGL|nr:unnamed protein product [Polarella glacialis]
MEGTAFAGYLFPTRLGQAWNAGMLVLMLSVQSSLTMAYVDTDKVRWTSPEQAIQSEFSAGFTTESRVAALAVMVESAKLRRELLTDRNTSTLAPSFACPPAVSGLEDSGRHDIEVHHYLRHKIWADNFDFCRGSFGLWTEGAGVESPLRAATIATAVGLKPGQLVLDVGSGCGNYAQWYYEWFGARTIGLDYTEEAVKFAQESVAGAAPAQFCWMDISRYLGDWLPSRSIDLAVSFGVFYYLRVDVGRFEAGPEPMPGEGFANATRTPCDRLAATHLTQCRVAREMFRVVRELGYVWIGHLGSYKGKWDPKRVWGKNYWPCCFREELLRQEVSLREVPESKLFASHIDWDPTYSLILKRLS